MIFVTFVTLLFRRTSASISNSLKDIFEQVTSVTNVTKITKVTKVTHFFKDKKREVAYLQIRCTPFCYLDHTKPLSKTPIFVQKLRNLLRFSGNSCSSTPEVDDPGRYKNFLGKDPWPPVAETRK